MKCLKFLKTVRGRMVWPGEGINKLVIKPGNHSAGALKWSGIRSILDMMLMPALLCHKHTVQGKENTPYYAILYFSLSVRFHLNISKPTSTEPLHCLAFLAQQRGEESNHIYLLFIFTLLN